MQSKMQCKKDMALNANNVHAIHQEDIGKGSYIWLLTSSQHQFVDSFRRRFVRVHGEFVAIRRAGGGVMGAVTEIYTEMVNAVK